MSSPFPPGDARVAFGVASLSKKLDISRAFAGVVFTDGAAFRRVIMPHLWPALVTGTGLAFVRSLGEFGAIIFIAGNMPYETEITALMIFVKLQEYDYAGASAIASVVLFVSLALLLAINIWQGRFVRRLHGGKG